MDDALRRDSGATPSAEWLGSRPGRDASGVQNLNAIRIYAVAPAFGLKSSPVLSIVCIITDSLRATATAARLKPILSRSWRPHVRSKLETRKNLALVGLI